MRNSIWTALLALGVLFALVWLQGLLTKAPPGEETERAVLRVLVDGEVREMALEDYVAGVTAAEMPARFRPEALKAQAVAARTYALYCARGGKHTGAEVCADSSCCQAWLSDDALRQRWGAEFEARWEKITAAVQATAGEILVYEGQAVFAAFHSSSAGFTEDCGAIWSELPYLKSVFSPESADSVPNYVTRISYSVLDFRDTLLYARPAADFSAPPEEWIGETERDASGRVAALSLGSERFTGAELRSLFSLRSTAFTLAYADGAFVFTVTGFGHGVGMSQYGAEVMAENGADYRSILAHYYPGTELVTAGTDGVSL